MDYNQFSSKHDSFYNANNDLINNAKISNFNNANTNPSQNMKNLNSNDELNKYDFSKYCNIDNNPRNIHNQNIDLSKDKKPENNNFYTNSILSLVKNNTNTFLRTNSTMILPQSSNTDKNKLINLYSKSFLSPNTTSNNNNSNNYSEANNEALKSNNYVENSYYNKKNNYDTCGDSLNYFNKNINFEENIWSNSFINSHSDSKTNTGTHNSKSNIANLKSKPNIFYEENTTTSTKLPPFATNTDSLLNTGSNTDNPKVSSFNLEKQEHKKSIRKVIDLNCFNQRNGSNQVNYSNDLITNMNSTKENEPEIKAENNIEYNQSSVSKYDLNKASGNNIISHSKYINSFETNKKQSEMVNSDINRNQNNYSYNNSNDYIDSTKYSKKDLNTNLNIDYLECQYSYQNEINKNNHNYNNYNNNKFQGCSMNGINSNKNSNEIRTNPTTQTGLNNNLYSINNYKSDVYNFTDNKNTSRRDLIQDRKDYNINNNIYYDSNSNGNLINNNINNTNSKFDTNNYGVKNLDFYSNNANNLLQIYNTTNYNNINNINNNHNTILNEVYTRKPYNTGLNEIDLNEISNSKPNNTNDNYSNTNKFSNQENKYSSRVNNAVDNLSNINKDYVYVSSKSIGKNLNKENKTRDTVLGNNNNHSSKNIYAKSHHPRSISNIPSKNENKIIQINKNLSARMSPKNDQGFTSDISNTNKNNNANYYNSFISPSFNRGCSSKNLDGIKNVLGIIGSNGNNSNLFNTRSHKPPMDVNDLNKKTQELEFIYNNNNNINNNNNENLFNKQNQFLSNDSNTKANNSVSNKESINCKNFSFGPSNLSNEFALNSNLNNPFSTSDKNDYNKFNKNHNSKSKKTDAYHSQQDFTINLEDLLMIEEKLFEILNVINKNNICYHECFDWWNLYYNCSLCGSFEHYFKDTENKQIVREYMFTEMIGICLAYDSCFNSNYFNSINYILKNIFNFFHENFIILCDYILSKISSESRENIWVRKLDELLSQNTKLKNLKNKHTKEIRNNNQCVFDYIKLILKNHPNDNIADPLSTFLKNIAKLNIETLNDFFRSKIIRIENKRASNLASCIVQSDLEEIKVIPAPYINNNPEKEYCLVLDLDETLIHFKIDAKDDSSGLLRLRPGIFKFLDEVANYYEIIVFTAATSEYADPILDAIESKKRYFSYAFYREHTVVEDDDYVKDISRIGRDLSKMIIVDNMPQNFRLQKENGILIKAFYGEDQSDKALLELIPILREMGKIPGKDIRESLALFKDEILKKVSSNLSRK